tara:strand:- start:118 stop:468 length:351 start_codon:yes stop_codon:yes gene_type:complete
MKKLKPLLPSLREKKRYLVFEILSKNKINKFEDVSKAFWDQALSFLGNLGIARAGFWILADKYDSNKQTGIMKVNHKNVDEARAVLSLVQTINNQPVIMRSLGVTGILNKTKKYLG